MQLSCIERKKDLDASLFFVVDKGGDIVTCTEKRYLQGNGGSRAGLTGQLPKTLAMKTERRRQSKMFLNLHKTRRDLSE